MLSVILLSCSRLRSRRLSCLLLLLGLILLVCYPLQLTNLFSVLWLLVLRFSWNKVMLFRWYMWALKYHRIPVVKVWAVLCQSVKEFPFLCGTLPWLVLYVWDLPCFSVFRSLTSRYAFLLLFILMHTPSIQSKKISNDQELIQSDPTSCPRN